MFETDFSLKSRVSCLYTHLDNAISRYVPVETIFHNCQVRPWFTEELDKLREKKKETNGIIVTDARGMIMTSNYSEQLVTIHTMLLRRLSYCFIMRVYARIRQDLERAEKSRHVL